MNTPHFVLVDDDPFALMLMEGLLKAAFAECRIDSLRDGDDALSHMLKETPDLVVTDYKMARMDGAELTSQLRSFGVDVPVIMISNHPFANDKAAAAGVTAFVEKMDVIEELIPTIKVQLLPTLESA